MVGILKESLRRAVGTRLLKGNDYTIFVTEIEIIYVQSGGVLQLITAWATTELEVFNHQVERYNETHTCSLRMECHDEEIHVQWEDGKGYHPDFIRLCINITEHETCTYFMNTGELTATPPNDLPIGATYI
uniref:Fibronectin type-III domain-containing protein n=1 Tax=Heterorhabditis bacteriophora TaxID=37862 RepID=A0A1I7WVC5_HETBA